MDIFFSARTLKIAAQFVKTNFKTNRQKPKITLSGDWLQKAGFGVGEQVTIMVADGKLIITKEP